ncbi:metal ABC transporter permease [Breznakiella homolactica]|uniref:Metal ABC transporter permease n=1 Tax=Breznakiella homolactica TaxID=2798577 RepID=A0A7T7XQ46_9SPIR|nr:metal ABC transporter permease [Breznakiella homolactica]QQO10440.1 metal ABC transporter permease [Breznakiella homolactica]
MIREILAIPALSRGLAALIATGISFPVIGTLILCLELVPARFAVMHVALLGSALGMVFGIDPTVSALAAAALAGFLVARLGEKSGASASGPLGLVMTLAMALAFIIFYKTDINGIEAFNLFWGNILALNTGETRLTIAAAVLLPVLIAGFLRPILAVLFDRDLAAASGYPARAIYYILVIGVCLGVGLAMRLTGALMADASTILPALAARNMRKDFSKTLLWGAVFGLVNNIGGFVLALVFDLPISPAIIVMGAVSVFASSRIGKPAGLSLRRKSK